MTKIQIYLIDGSAYLYRAFHAIPHLSTSKGVPTNAAFGVTTMLLKLMKEREPDYAAIFFDVKGATFRHKMYADYKANRAAMPDELIEQIPIIKEIIRALNIPIVEKEGFEADDLIGTYARIAQENGFSVVMVTGDKDFMQLVTDDCVIWDPMKDKLVDKEAIKNEFDIAPEQVIDMLGLAGDTSDNIPGVPGVGPKTALKLIAEFGSIQAIYDNIEKLKSKKSLYSKLIENRKQAFLSYKLVTIDKFVDTNLISDADNIENRDFSVPPTDKEKSYGVEEVEKFKLQPYDNYKLTELFKTLEFRKLYQEFFQAPVRKENEKVEKTYICLRDIKDVESLTQEIERFVRGIDSLLPANQPSDNNDFINNDSIKSYRCVAVDTETTSVNPMLAELVGISISFKPHHAFYIPVGHVEPKSSSNAEELFVEQKRKDTTKLTAVVQPDKAAVLSILKPLLENPLIEKVGQNIKYDYIVLARNGIYMQGMAFDTMIASYLLNPSGRGHGLDQIALDLLGHKNITYKEVSSQVNNFSEVSIDKATDYACEDADITLLAHDILRNKIEENNLEELMQTIEMPLIPVLATMEMNGIKVNREKLRTLSKRFEQELQQIEQKIFAIAGEKFNINSSQQLGHILFERLNLPVQKKTKKKTGYSTDIAVLTDLANQHELPAMVLRYRSLGKLKSTYTDALQELIHPETGRIHTSFNQAVTATGRLSSSDPNLQNIPIRTEEGRQIREAFIPEKRYKLVSADYSQIELRILAHFADDKILIEAFQNDEDIHARTAAEVFQAMPEFIDAELRRQAKAINFGIVYGMGAFKLSNELSISRRMAQTYIDNYFARYSGVKRYIDSTIEQAKETGEVTTLLGRKRRLDDIHSSNANVRGLAERMAINTPIQGSAADIIKLAMIKMDKALKEAVIIDNEAGGGEIVNLEEGGRNKGINAERYGRKMRSRMLLSVHDEILFEVPEDELEQLKSLAQQVMEGIRVIDGVVELKVPLKVNIDAGDNWAEAH
ncbi:MAG: DNA polymerase I [Desulfamplus sp.]|nr:DNA polymerase I [Desulfamplus sp.]